MRRRTVSCRARAPRGSTRLGLTMNHQKCLLIAGVVGLLLVTGFNAHACKCLKLEGFAPLFKNATHVFSARITSAKEIMVGSEPMIEAEFSLTEVFKGAPEKLRALNSFSLSGPKSNSCAVPFTTGADYIIFAGNNGLVEYCSGSREYNRLLDASLVEQLRELKNKKP